MATSATTTKHNTRKIQCSAMTSLGDVATSLYPNMDESFGIRAMLLFAALPQNDTALKAFAADGPYATDGTKWVDPAVEKAAKVKQRMEKITEGLSPEQVAQVQLQLKIAEEYNAKKRDAMEAADKAMRDAMAAITKIKGPVVPSTTTTVQTAIPTATTPAPTPAPTPTAPAKHAAAPAKSAARSK